ncbi:hypothetical protein, partial [Vibrio parahaemolyticus]|uniref:hypothetical protein n=1 Tax=Vibrio parahaemolyticus TaxID=670 RepID=UPI001BAFA552
QGHQSNLKGLLNPQSTPHAIYVFTAAGKNRLFLLSTTSKLLLVKTWLLNHKKGGQRQNLRQPPRFTTKASVRR